MNARTPVSAALGLALLLTACGGSGGGAGDGDPQERIDEARATIEDAEAITIEITSADMPDDVDGVREGTGTGVMQGDEIAFEGEFRARVNGISATVPVLAIGDDTWMRLFTPDYETIDLATLGVPNPVGFFDPDTGIAALLAATTDLADAGEVREGREVLARISGTLPGESVESLLYLGAPDATFDVTYGLTADNELRSAVLEGEFWAGTTSTYTLVLTDYGQVVTIERPGS